MLVEQPMGSIVILTLYASPRVVWLFLAGNKLHAQWYADSGQIKVASENGKKLAWELFEHKVVCQTEYVAIRWTVLSC